MPEHVSNKIRVSGHVLAKAGAIVDDDSQFINRPGRHPTTGRGRALCTCGLLSSIFNSNLARRQWHRTHREQILSTQQQQ